MKQHLEPLGAPENQKIDGAWFTAIARRLLDDSELLIANSAYRIKEIEFYYYGEGHLDPFAHRQPLQRSCCRWYFHRAQQSYRGGSFKGLDLSFGPEASFGGILIRTIETPEGELINGCSLCVDHMLAQTGFAEVAALDAALGQRKIWRAGPLTIRPAPEPADQPIFATARVGLTLKKAHLNPEMPRYIMKPYRFLNDPTIKKGKLHTVVALHRQGRGVGEIRALTQSPAASVERYLTAYGEGLEVESFAPYRGRALTTAALCRLHGTWHRRFGGEG